MISASSSAKRQPLEATWPGKARGARRCRSGVRPRATPREMALTVADPSRQQVLAPAAPASPPAAPAQRTRPAPSLCSIRTPSFVVGRPGQATQCLPILNPQYGGQPALPIEIKDCKIKTPDLNRVFFLLKYFINSANIMLTYWDIVCRHLIAAQI
jgi:hypothetical protein